MVDVDVHECLSSLCAVLTSTCKHADNHTEDVCFRINGAICVVCFKHPNA